MVGFFPGVSFFRVAVGAVANFILSFLVGDGLRHFQRGEDAFAEEFAEGLAGNFRHH